MSAFDKATPQNDRLPATLRAPSAPGFTMKRVMSSDRLPVMVSCRRREGNHPGPVAADTFSCSVLLTLAAVAARIKKILGLVYRHCYISAPVASGPK